MNTETRLAVQQCAVTIMLPQRGREDRVFHVAGDELQIVGGDGGCKSGGPSKLRASGSECAIDQKWKNAWKSLRPEGLSYRAEARPRQGRQSRDRAETRGKTVEWGGNRSEKVLLPGTGETGHNLTQ